MSAKYIAVTSQSDPLKLGLSRQVLKHFADFKKDFSNFRYISLQIFLACWLVISRDCDTVLLGEAPLPRARVLGSMVEISTPNSSLEISSIDQTRMTFTEQTIVFSCNLRNRK